MSMEISNSTSGNLKSSKTEKNSGKGVVRPKNAKHAKPPMILAKTSNPRLKPLTVTPKLNKPKV